MITLYVLSILCLSGMTFGYEAYNSTNICCDGEIGKSGLSCCGKKIYNSSQETCCAGKVYQLPEGAQPYQMGCCEAGKKGTPYNTSVAVCCGGVLTETFPGINAANFYGCCDNPKTKKSIPYLSSIYACCSGSGKLIGKQNPNDNSYCCGNQLLEYPDYRCRYPMPFEKRMIMPFPPVYTDYKQCCANKQVFDPKTELCASVYDPVTQMEKGKVFKMKNNHSSTCGLKVYDTETQDCCNQVVFTKKTQACCNSVVVKLNGPAKLMACCFRDGKMFDVRSIYCSDTGIQNLKKAVKEQYEKFLSMCDSFDPNIPSYSNEVSKLPYQTSNATHICCNDEVGPNSMQCCGNGELYDPTQKTCCNDKLFAPEKGQDLGQSSCCRSDDGKTNKLFNYNTEVCCDGNVMKKNESSSGCCTNPKTKITQLFNFDTARCCNGVIKNLPQNTTKYYECCGNELMEANYEVVIFGQSGAADRCCGSLYKYKPANQICASSYNRKTYKTTFKVLTIKNNHTMSCGLKPYDTEKQGCCNEEPYSLLTQTCCNSNVVTTSIPWPLASCCYPSNEPYDVRKQFCNGTAVADLDPKKAKQIEKDLKKCKYFPPNLPTIYPGPIMID